MNNTQNIYITTYVFNNHSTIQYNIIYFHNFHPSIIIHNYYYTSPCNSIILFSYTVYTMDMGKSFFIPMCCWTTKKEWFEMKKKERISFTLFYILLCRSAYPWLWVEQWVAVGWVNVSVVFGRLIWCLYVPIGLLGVGLIWWWAPVGGWRVSHNLWIPNIRTEYWISVIGLLCNCVLVFV